MGDERSAVSTVVSAHKELSELLEEEAALLSERPMRRHRLLMAQRALFKAQMFDTGPAVG